MNPLHEFLELLREIRKLLLEILHHVRPRKYLRSSGGRIAVK